MLVEGSVVPAKVKIKKVKRGMANVVLRRSIEEKELEGEGGENDIVYQYEEVEVELANRVNLEDYIEENFDMIFEAGLEKEDEFEESIEDRIERLEQEIESLKAK